MVNQVTQCTINAIKKKHGLNYQITTNHETSNNESNKNNAEKRQN